MQQATLAIPDATALAKATHGPFPTEHHARIALAIVKRIGERRASRPLIAALDALCTPSTVE